MVSFLFILLIITAIVYSSPIGSCPDTFHALENFQLQNFTGRWYERARSFMPQEIGTVCVNAQYTATSDPKKPVHVRNEASKSIGGPKDVIEGYAYPAGDPTVAKLLVHLDGVPSEAPLWVLDTDYSSFALLYSCANLTQYFHYDFAWIVTRDYTVDYSQYAQRYEKLGFDISRLSETPQSKDCNY